MNAAGRTLHASEIEPLDLPVYVTDNSDVFPIERSDVYSDRIELRVNDDFLLSDDQAEALDLLRKFMAKEINANQLRKEAQGLL